MKLRKILLATGLIAMIPASARAATIEQLNTVNWESVPEENQLDIEDCLSDIPDCVTKLHKLNNATVTFVQGTFSDGRTFSEDRLNGFYRLDNNNIEVNVQTEPNEPHTGKTTITHELGHFLYYQTYNVWSDESKQQLSALFDRKYNIEKNLECYNEHETFAWIYAYVRGEHQYYNEEVLAMIEEAEDICWQILESYPHGTE